jgi:cleavage stimulation factor subunit 3
MYIQRIQFENELDERNQVAVILNEALMQLPNVDLFKLYLDHVRRALPLINDTTGQNRAEIVKAFELTLEHVGIDPDSGNLWREYIDFLKDGPGNIGGQSWQDLQKVDLLRKAYQRAIKLPHSEFVRLWKEYETFEMNLHKATGRKHIQEQSPHYMQARTAKMQLDQKIEGLDRKSLPKLPPIYGFAGEDEFGEQVEKWRSWIAWESEEDPLVYKGSEDEMWRKRVLYIYKQATMTLCFYPEIWFEAASWCFSQGIDSLILEGEQFLERGIKINPESVLLAMTKADRVESSLESGNTDEVLIRNGKKLDEPYEAVHSALYALRSKALEKDKRAVAQIQEHFASLPPEDGPMQNQTDDDDEDDSTDKPQTREEQMKAQIDAVKQASTAHMDLIKRTISYVWVAKMRAFRRVQGQGKPPKKGAAADNVVKGFRGIFGEARPRGPLSSDVYIASALMEWQCYRDPSAVKIFERGMKLFPTDESFILEYIKHLIGIGDITNARVVFESTLPRITGAAEVSEEQKRERCRPLIAYMHDFESKYGDLAQIHKIEKRMAELYPDEPEINRFALRFSLPTFDAMSAQLMLSPTQARPKPTEPYLPTVGAPPLRSIEGPSSPRATGPMGGPEILLGPNGPYVASPKRPLEDSDNDGPARKFMRGESPLKGAAGARMVSQTTGGKGGFATKTFVPTNTQPGPPPASLPPPLPPQIDAILRILPNPSAYNSVRFDGAKLAALAQSVNVEQKKQLLQQGVLQLSRR